MSLIIVCSGCHRDVITNQPHTQTSTGAWCERCWPREEIADLARELITTLRQFGVHGLVVADQGKGVYDQDCEGFSSYDHIWHALDNLESRLLRLGR